MIEDQLMSEVASALSCSVVDSHSVSGGDIGSAFRMRTDDGRELFVKTYAANGHQMVSAEVDGLHWLAQAAAMRIPEVLACSDGAGVPFLVLEFLTSGRRRRDFDEILGRGLATLHRVGADGFGLSQPNFIGSLPQDNTWEQDWPTFYRQRRILPLARQAQRSGLLSAALFRQCEVLCDRLDQLVGPAEPPARLHGDLWAGNLHSDESGQPVLIDPSVYGGCREMDLAMMKLFGGFSETTFAAYLEQWPLDPDWRERVLLYQLYPLLVHVNLFGSAYTGRVANAVQHYL